MYIGLFRLLIVPAFIIVSTINSPKINSLEINGSQSFHLNPFIYIILGFSRTLHHFLINHLVRLLGCVFDGICANEINKKNI